MSKITLAISCPLDTYSGYGARSRDLVKALLKTGKYNINVISQRWGNTRFGYLKDHNEDELASLIIPGLQSQPDVWIQITVPNEFQKVGKYSIGITAGIETTQCHGSWIEGCNRMDLVITSSKHSQRVFTETVVDVIDKKTQQKVKEVKLQVPTEVLFEGVDTQKYYKLDKLPKVEFVDSINSIPEQFCYLSVGHWMQGDYGQDRKNLGYTVKTFLETFKTKQKPPALILKTSTSSTSIMDREKILEKINAIRKTVRGGRLANIYVIHGEISDEEMNILYNHPKVKVYVSHTKGEGYGRPLAEFATSGKPIIASGWSGQSDFLDKDMSILIGGTLTKVHKSSVLKDMIIEDATWFTPNDSDTSQAYQRTFKHYKDCIPGARKQRRKILDEFTFEKMSDRLSKILDDNIPEFPSQIELTLPKLDLPKL
jgi:glycosyltransferase involved in cell wall biosynthesis